MTEFGEWLGQFLADPGTAANQTTLIVVAVIGATASIATASITAFFAYLMVKVNRLATATHSIVNHDRQVILEGQAQTLRVAIIDHPADDQLLAAWQRAEAAAQSAREGNALPASRVA